MKALIYNEIDENNIQLNDLHTMVKEKFITQNKELSKELLSGTEAPKTEIAPTPATPGRDQKRTTDYIIEEYNKSMQNKSKDYNGTAVMCIKFVKIQGNDIDPFKKYIIKTELDKTGNSTYKIIIDPETEITEDEINENFKYKLETTHYIKYFYTNATIDFKDKIINIKYKGKGDNTFTKNTLYRVTYINNTYSIYKNSTDAVLQEKDRITNTITENEINTNFELALKHPPIVKIYNELNNIKTTSEKAKEISSKAWTGAKDFGSKSWTGAKDMIGRFSRSKPATKGGKYKSRRYYKQNNRFTRRNAWK